MTSATTPFHQPQLTKNLVALVQAIRREQNVSIERLTSWMTDEGYPINYHQYAAIEDGKTKAVPVEVIVRGALYLEIPATTLFPMLDF